MQPAEQNSNGISLFQRKKKTPINQESEPGMVEEVFSHDQSNRIMNQINGNESNQVVNDPENNLYYNEEQKQNKQVELMLDEATYLISKFVKCLSDDIASINSNHSNQPDFSVSRPKIYVVCATKRSRHSSSAHRQQYE